MPGHDVIVMGASMGGVEAFKAVVSKLPRDLAAAVFIVWHIAAESVGMLPRILKHAGGPPATNAEDGEEIRPGHIYVAPPDRHLVLEPGRVRVTRGPKENHFRPAVDPLFRSAALHFGPRVIGVILTGSLDDGTAGLWAVKASGGLTVVQEPADAFCPAMPLSALENVQVDYRAPLADLAPLLVRLVAEPAADSQPHPDRAEMEVETKIALQNSALRNGIMALGDLTPYTCPECHGVLLRLKTGGVVRFRCHTGHAFTANSLLTELTQSVEEGLWNAVRAIEESVLLMRHLARHFEDGGEPVLAAKFRRKAAEANQRGERVRQVVLQHDSPSREKLEEQTQEG